MLVFVANKVPFTEVEIAQAMILHKRRREADHLKRKFIAKENGHPLPVFENITKEQLRENAIADLQALRERREIFETVRLPQ